MHNPNPVTLGLDPRAHPVIPRNRKIVRGAPERNGSSGQARRWRWVLGAESIFRRPGQAAARKDCRPRFWSAGRSEVQSLRIGVWHDRMKFQCPPEWRRGVLCCGAVKAASTKGVVRCLYPPPLSKASIWLLPPPPRLPRAWPEGPYRDPTKQEYCARSTEAEWIVGSSPTMTAMFWGGRSYICHPGQAAARSRQYGSILIRRAIRDPASTEYRFAHPNWIPAFAGMTVVS